MRVTTRFLPAFLSSCYAVMLLTQPALAVEKIRVGTLKSGTFNWELEAIRQNGLDKKHNLELDAMEIAGNPGTLIALQGSEVDVIVTDWFWVSDQRAHGKKITAVPYSKAVGSLMLKKGGTAKTIADLKGGKIGITGGPSDKNWVLLQAVSIKQNNVNIKTVTDTVFGAPPLLAKKLEQGELDAVFMFWHIAAKYSAMGYTTLVDGESLMKEAGLQRVPALLVYAFTEEFASQHPKAISAYLEASYEAKQLLLKQDEAWKPLREMMKAESDSEY
ncbi:MAG: ABC transporter substrate-binding protein, partial [Deltaproteobacteria bacterium]|nr:ABC transporter substrate-binding protein [Deltaproteobacteria bacterium]